MEYIIPAMLKQLKLGSEWFNRVEEVIIRFERAATTSWKKQTFS